MLVVWVRKAIYSAVPCTAQHISLVLQVNDAAPWKMRSAEQIPPTSATEKHLFFPYDSATSCVRFNFSLCLLLPLSDEEEEENLDDQDEQGNLKGFINDDDDEEEEEEEEASDSGDSEDDVGHKKRKRSKCWARVGGQACFESFSLLFLVGWGCCLALVSPSVLGGARLWPHLLSLPPTPSSLVWADGWQFVLSLIRF